MTKEKLYKEIVGGMGVSYAHKQVLDKFFELNMVVPKGENRHPYADVLHEWAEDTRKRIEYDNNGTFMWFGCPLPIDGSELRIKPSEPIYEYLWYTEQGETKWMTNDEWYSTEKIFIKAEETKRERT